MKQQVQGKGLALNKLYNGSFGSFGSIKSRSHKSKHSQHSEFLGSSINSEDNNGQTRKRCVLKSLKSANVQLNKGTSVFKVGLDDAESLRNSVKNNSLLEAHSHPSSQSFRPVEINN